MIKEIDTTKYCNWTKFNISKTDNDGLKMYNKSTIMIHNGITILVGCNGSGKTTLFRQIINNCEDSNIPYCYYNDRTDGGINQADAIFQFGGSPTELAAIWCESEGERIYHNLVLLSDKIKKCIKEAKNNKYNSVIILLDALDSGFSIDNIIEVKEFFNILIEDTKKKDNIDLYFIIAANEYEMASGEDCFDVVNGEYIKFENYEDYKEFIIKSRELKDKRDEAYKNNVGDDEDESTTEECS